MPGQKQFPCRQCGAMLEYEPGTTSLKCKYCGAPNEIPKSEQLIEELDYLKQLDDLTRDHPKQEATVFHCDGCGGESTLRDGVASGRCPFCGRAVVATSVVKKQIKPKALLPFAINSGNAKQRFDQWLSGRWFAPSGLKKFAESGGLGGIYLPAWTYDCRTVTDYTGQRGDHYYVTESYSSLENGKSVTRTRQIQRTRWSGAAGTVGNVFDDVLVLADRSLPPKLQSAMNNWDLTNLVPYQDDYLSGFVAETYQVELKDGFEIAKQVMDGTIRATIHSDIGGDEQRIDSMDTRYSDITFKHILVPVWISAYRFNNQTYHFAVNARNGAVYGERPWSAWKIVGLVLAIVITILVVLLITQA